MLHSLKLTAKAPENRPKLPQKEISAEPKSGEFSAPLAELLVSGRVHFIL